jgi:hypothetical protein
MYHDLRMKNKTPKYYRIIHKQKPRIKNAFILADV